MGQTHRGEGGDPPRTSGRQRRRSKKFDDSDDDGENEIGGGKVRIKLSANGGKRKADELDDDLEGGVEGEEVTVRVTVDGEPCPEGATTAVRQEAAESDDGGDDGSSDEGEEEVDVDEINREEEDVAKVPLPASGALKTEETSSDVSEEVFEDPEEGPAQAPEESESTEARQEDADEAIKEEQAEEEVDASDANSKTPPPGRGCKVDGCGKYRKARCDGYCMSCYRANNGGRSPPPAGEEDDSKVTKEGDHQSIKDPESQVLTTPTSKKPSTSTPGSKSSKYCAYEDCTRYRQTGCYGFCLTHKQNANPTAHQAKKQMATITSLTKKKTTNKSNLCKWADCTKYIQSNCNGYCLTHVKFANYEEGDGEDVTKVRVRLLGRLLNGFCQAILPEGLREEWGFGEFRTEVSDDMRGDQKDVSQKVQVIGGNDDVKMEEEDEEGETDSMEVDEQSSAYIAKPAATPVKEEEAAEDDSKDEEAVTPKKKDLSGLLDFAISDTPVKKASGATKCKAVGCPKNSQGNSHGFCRAHHNRFLICTGQCSSWDCVCGEKIVSFQARCGTCHRWRGGKHNMSTGGSTRSDMTPGREPKGGREAQEGGGDVAQDPGRAMAAAAGALTYVPPDAPVEISKVPLATEKGRPLCKVVGCGKMDQSGNDGFCRQHFRMFEIVREEDDVGGKQRKRDSDVSSDNIIEDDWTCDCGNVVPGRKSRCGNCHHWRGGKRRGGWKLGSGAFASNYDSDDGIDRTQDWECCGTKISARQTRCGKCNKWRGGKRVPASVSAAAAPPPTGPPWECGKCNMSNPGNKRRCGGCLTWKSQAGGRTGASKSSRSSSANASSSGVGGEGNSNWTCRKCNFDNFAGELQCFSCQGLRPNWQWHKKQQLIAAGGGGNGHQASAPPQGRGPVGAAVAAAARSFPSQQAGAAPSSAANAYAAAMASGAQASDAANGRAIAIAAAAAAQEAPDKFNYYGTVDRRLPYAYVSVHYDYNRAYYRNNDYEYLLTGAGTGVTREENDSSTGKTGAVPSVISVVRSDASGGGDGAGSGVDANGAKVALEQAV